MKQEQDLTSSTDQTKKMAKRDGKRLGFLEGKKIKGFFFSYVSDVNLFVL